MTTLKQKFDYITKCYATIEEKNRMYYQAVKHWLQQKQNTIIVHRPKETIGFNKAINELLEELKQ